MDEFLKPLLEKLIEQASPTVLVLTFVIVLLSWLLVKFISRYDELVRELGKNSQSMARLSELVKQLVYGRGKE